MRASRLVVALLLLAASLQAGWNEVTQATSSLDLGSAREHALATVAADSQGPEAVAAAGWWLRNLELLAEPEAILAAGASARDPELAFLIGLVEGALTLSPPAGTLATVELAGPFGAFDTLDLERDVVPPDPRLPPLGTPWRSPAEPFNLRLRSADGWVGPPEAMAVGGVYLAAWTLPIGQHWEGFLVVECAGSFDLELDTTRIARVRDCGQRVSAASWFRVELEPGSHRLRLAMASQGIPRLRVTLLDPAGRPAPLVDAAPAASALAARAWPELPPASADLLQQLDGENGHVDALLLAAALARGRGDPVTTRRLLERAATLAPDDPRVHLELAHFFLTEPTGADREVDYRHAQEQLRGCADLPAHLLVAYELARRQRQNEERERLLDRLVLEHGADPRVLVEWVHEAVRRGWAREAEDSLGLLERLLPASRAVADLKVDVLAGLERWEERRLLLSALAATQPGRVREVEQLAATCLGEEALAALERLRARVDDPDLDLAAIRLRQEVGDQAQARQELAAARARWGTLPALDLIGIGLAAANPEELDSALASALARDPSNLDPTLLAWRRGVVPFFTPFQVDALALAAEQPQPSSEVDAVLLLDQAVERVYPDGSSLYYYHGLTRALTPAGAEQAATLQRMEQATLITLRVVKPDGRIVIPPELQAGEPRQTLAHVDPGDLVEEEFVTTVRPSGPSRRAHLSPYVYRFADPERAFGLSEYVLLVPRSVAIEVDGRFDGLEFSEEEHDGLRLLRWRAERVAPVTPEPFAPPPQELLPWVTYGFGVTWQDVGDGVRDRMLAVLHSSTELDAWARPLLQSEDSVTQVRALVAGVCDEISSGKSVLDLGTSGSESFSRRRDNRLGVVAAALAATGWELDLVLARPLELARTRLKVPTPDAFVVPLLRATRSGRPVWVDLAEERSGVDHISPLLQGSDALVLPLSQPGQPVTYLERLPEFANPELEEKMSVSARLDSAGGAHLSFSVTLSGGQGERTMTRARGVPEDQVGMVYRQVAAGLFPGAENVRGTLAREDDHVLLALELDLPGACEVAGDTMTCRSLSLAKPLAPSLASLPSRRFPLVLDLPLTQVIELELVPPPGFGEHRAPRRLAARWGSLDEALAHDGSSLRSTLRLALPAQVVAPEDYPEFARFCHAVDELAARPLVLRRESYGSPSPP